MTIRKSITRCGKRWVGNSFLKKMTANKKIADVAYTTSAILRFGILRSKILPFRQRLRNIRIPRLNCWNNRRHKSNSQRTQ